MSVYGILYHRLGNRAGKSQLHIDEIVDDTAVPAAVTVARDDVRNFFFPLKIQAILGIIGTYLKFIVLQKALNFPLCSDNVNISSCASQPSRRQIPR